jgi:Na+-driven multidrug efflux pump
MNGDTRVTQLNQLVRAICVFTLLFGFTFAFIWGVLHNVTVISTDAFAGVLGGVLTWWFKSRDEEQTQKAVAQAATDFVKANGGLKEEKKDG